MNRPPNYRLTWTNIGNVPSEAWVCWKCGNKTANDRGFQASEHSPSINRGVLDFIYICPLCGYPSYFETGGAIYPGAPFGDPVPDVPESLSALYEEARRGYSAACFTSCVLACRKLLMHIAVEKGAEPNQSFLSYVEYLAKEGYVPPDGKEWVDHIREKGNEANHEIVLMNPSDSEDLISFSEMLLRFLYEFPARVKAKRSPPGAAE